MSDTMTREDVYNLIFAKLPDWIQPEKRQHIAVDVLGEIEPHIRGGIGHNMPPEPIEGETEEDRLKRIDPTKLLTVPVATLPRLFAVQFPDLVRRAEEFKQQALAWKADHTTVKGGLIDIASDEENTDLSVLMGQLRGFISDDGEVHTARKACKQMVWDGIHALDAFFKNLIGPIEVIYGPGKEPPLGTMNERQTTFLRAKAAREQLERQRIAEAAEVEARRLSEAARKAAEEEEARVKTLESTGVDTNTAREIAAAVTDRAAEEADAAISTSSLIGQAAQAPPAALVRTQSATGITTTLAGTWDFDTTNVDMMKVCRAIVDGKVPITFITLVPQAIRQAIRAKINPLRDCPGLDIKQTFAARRTGR